MGVLDIQNLRVTFKQKSGDVQAVRGVSFSIDTQGESIGIVGESGSGKSVTSLAVMRLLKKNQALVEVDKMEFMQENLLAKSDKAMQRMRGKHISMIFQEPMTSLDPVFTIGQQMIETIMLHQNVNAKKAWKIATAMLDRVDIGNSDKIMKYYPHQLSGGMRQRVMIAMSLVCKPSILIADEPTTALDVTVQAQVLKLIKDLQKELGMSLMMITHDLGVIAETVDKVVVMYGGKVLEIASVFDLYEKPAQPYTCALLKSIPDITQPRDAKLHVIEGSSPNPKTPPTGCPFHPRCLEAIGRCREEFPPETKVSDTHTAYCWRLV
jgi:oligopeptide/dipeptide ABC transporter ATP-binding protein